MAKDGSAAAQSSNTSTLATLCQTADQHTVYLLSGTWRIKNTLLDLLQLL